MYDGWNDENVNYRTADVILRIKKLKAQTLLSLSDGEELAGLERELEDVRKRCHHAYDVILLFNRHRRFCRLCDAEDHSYVHQD